MTTDPITAAALFLAEHVEWMRHRPEVAELLADVDACHRVVRGIARGPAEQKYLGPCGAVLAATVEPCPEACTCRSGPRTALSDACAGCFCLTACHPTVGTDAEGQVCHGDVYAFVGSTTGRCRTCGAQVATADREAWLDGRVREEAFTARWIADAYSLNVKTIRTWAARGQLASYWRTDAGLTVEWTDPPLDPDLDDEQRAAREQEITDELDARGPRLHYVGDVLDLAAADAARRAEQQARRARRREQATTEGDAA